MPFPFRGSTTRRATRGLVITGLFFIIVLFFLRDSTGAGAPSFTYVTTPIRPERYPIDPRETIRLPRRSPQKIPQIQHAPVIETSEERRVRESRLAEVKAEFIHAWNGYKKEAWAHDEMRPVEGGFKSPFCGWAATMVDALDTLWIMELYDEFEASLVELRNIDFTNTEGCQVNLFETTIRHLGGMLAAFDLSGGRYPILVQKAVELAEILFSAFDTPNRMPSPHYLWSATNPDAHNHQPSSSIVLAVLGTLSLEFTRLSQITGNDKYYDGIQRIMNELEKWQDNTQLPGMWPAMVDSNKINESIVLGSPYEGGNEIFTLGALADSAYEYLPKQWLLLGGTDKSYRIMYEKFIATAKKYLFFRPMTIADEDILISGLVNTQSGYAPRHTPEIQHLTCFVGGMVAIAGKIFNNPEDVNIGAKLADGCVWAYKNTVTGIMPENCELVPCENTTSCKWDKEKWYNTVIPNGDESLIEEKIVSAKLSPGFASVQDARYLLRPEAIESVFIMHRISADSYWAESGWTMFKSIIAQTRTESAHSAINDVLSSVPKKTDEMESFWLAETLKYFYLLFSEPSVVSLDEYVLNTEAHPLRRPR